MALWSGLFRQRCIPSDSLVEASKLSFDYFKVISEESQYMCSSSTFGRNCPGNFTCQVDQDAMLSVSLCSLHALTRTRAECQATDQNPNMDLTSFDNILVAFVVIFQIISLNNWTSVLYSGQDTAGYSAVLRK